MEFIPLLVVLILKIIILKFRFLYIFYLLRISPQKSLHHQDVFVKINRGKVLFEYVQKLFK